MPNTLRTTARAAAVAATALSIILLVNPADAKTPAWEPIAAPAEVVGPVQILILAIDESGSMKGQTTLTHRAKAAGKHAVAEANPCTYAIITLFGSEARVLNERFLCSRHDRQVLLDAVESVTMSAARTDVGALESLLTSIRDAVSDKFGHRGFRLEIQVLTDGEPDPVDRAEEQTFDSILMQPTTESELGDGLLLYVVELHSIQADGAASAPTRAAPAVPGQLPPIEPTPVPAAQTEAPEAGPNTPGLARHLLLLGIGAILFALGVFVVVARRRAQRAAETVLDNTGVSSLAAVPSKSPIALQITEWHVSDERERTLAQGPLAVRYTPNVPITIGADEGRVLVGLHTPGVSARLASLTLDGRGDGVVVPLDGAFRFDGEEVTHQLVFAADHPHILAVGATEVHIEPISTLPETENELYRRLSESAGETADGDVATGVPGTPTATDSSPLHETT